MVVFNRNKDGKVSISFTGLTQGSALALCHALKLYSEYSPACDDLRAILRNRIQETTCNSDDNQELFEVLN